MRKPLKPKKNYVITTIAVLLILAFVVLPNVLPNFDDIGNKITTIFTTVTAIIGAGALFVQFKKDKQINQASFITEYSKQFYDTFHCEDIFAVLDSALDNYEIKEEDLDDKLKHDLVNYLIWCEGLCSLVLQGILPIKQIDSLFSYRFFLVTNNKYVQDFELVPYSNAYVEIVTVHKMWTAFKRENNLPIVGEESNLTEVLEKAKADHVDCQLGER